MTDYSKRYSKRASLAAVGIEMRRWKDSGKQSVRMYASSRK